MWRAGRSAGMLQEGSMTANDLTIKAADLDDDGYS